MPIRLTGWPGSDSSSPDTLSADRSPRNGYYDDAGPNQSNDDERRTASKDNDEETTVV